jgi:pyruvate/2-oxoglutarate/acetoin dehydrogenase E1 component
MTWIGISCAAVGAARCLNEALAQEMRRDPTIVVIGEDVSGGAGTDGQRGAYGGVLGVTEGLIDSAVEGARSAASRRNC